MFKELVPRCNVVLFFSQRTITLKTRKEGAKTQDDEAVILFRCNTETKATAAKDATLEPLDPPNGRRLVMISSNYNTIG